MMQVPVRSFLGLVDLPTHRTSAVAWLKCHGATVEKVRGNGGCVDVVSLSDLPAEVRRAVVERDVAAAGLPLGA
jgi:hypothetical protein